MSNKEIKEIEQESSIVDIDSLPNTNGLRPDLNKNASKAIRRIIHQHPFFASLLFSRLNVIFLTKEECPPNLTYGGTDGRNLYVNLENIDVLDINQAISFYIHEIMHVVYKHHIRMRGKNPERWNHATDYRINFDLIKDGFKLPPNILYDPGTPEVSSDVIYRMLQANENPSQGTGVQTNLFKQSRDSQGQVFGQVWVLRGADGKPLSEQELKDLENDLNIDIKNAYHTAKKAGKLPSFIERDFKELVKPKINWLAFIQQFVDEIVRSDYDWMVPDRRWLHQGFVFPDLHKVIPGPIAIGVDTSGSMGGEEIKIVCSEALYVMQTYNELGGDVEIPIIFCDAEINKVQFISDANEVIKPKGGGGTRFDPVFKWVNKNREEYRIRAVIYLTDGFSNDFGPAPDYPVLWGVLEGNPNFNPPFGEVVEITLK